MSPLLLILIVVIFYVVVMIPQNRRRKQTQAMQRSIAPGARIVTTSGIYGTVIDIDDESFMLEVDDDVQVRFVKGAVMRVLPETPDTVDVDGVDEDADAADPAHGTTGDAPSNEAARVSAAEPDSAGAADHTATAPEVDTAPQNGHGIPGPDVVKPAGRAGHDGSV